MLIHGTEKEKSYLNQLTVINYKLFGANGLTLAPVKAFWYLKI